MKNIRQMQTTPGAYFGNEGCSVVLVVVAVVVISIRGAEESEGGGGVCCHGEPKSRYDSLTLVVTDRRVMPSL